MGGTGWIGWMGRKGWTGGAGRMSRMDGTLKAFLTLVLLSVPAHPAYPAQVSFEQATRDLASPDAGSRLKAAQMLKEAGYVEAAVPLAALVTDPADEVQLEAIAAELNIFLEERIVPRKRIGFVIEVRNQVLAESAFSSGPLAIGAKPVPREVLTALRAASRDEQPRVALEAIYAFGVLAVEPSGEGRRELLQTSAPALAALLGVPDPAMRFAALRVIGRVFAPRVDDGPIEESLGDAVITALNDPDRAVKSAAMESLGLLRYARGVQALTELFQYYGKGEPAEAALDAIARVAYGASAPLFTSQLTAKSAALRGIARQREDVDHICSHPRIGILKLLREQRRAAGRKLYQIAVRLVAEPRPRQRFGNRRERRVRQHGRCKGAGQQQAVAALARERRLDGRELRRVAETGESFSGNAAQRRALRRQL